MWYELGGVWLSWVVFAGQVAVGAPPTSPEEQVATPEERCQKCPTRKQTRGLWLALESDTVLPDTLTDNKAKEDLMIIRQLRPRNLKDGMSG